MSGPVPTKIVLKSTTNISLNDRFTNIQKTRAQPGPSPQHIRNNLVQQQQASAKNRRLAQQFANRPGVTLPNPSADSPVGMENRLGGGAVIKNKRSLQQRLGRGNVKSRLNFAAVGYGGGGGEMQGGWVPQRGMRRGRGATRAWSAPPARGGFGRGAPRRPGSRGGFLQQRSTRGANRGGFRGNRGTRGLPSNRVRGVQGRGRSRGRGAGRGGRGGRGPGRGGGGRGRGMPQNVSREELDNQLEEYMSKTKNHLDGELDAYMADAS